MAVPTDRQQDAGDRPRLRRDLVVVRTSFGGEPALVVADRRAGRYVKYGADAAPLLALLDGTRGIDELAVAASREAGAELPARHVRAFVSGLAARGFLDGVPASLPRARRNPLALRLRLGDPDRLVGRLGGLGRALFSPPAIASAVLLAAAGAAVLAVHGPAARIPRFDAPATLVAFYLAAAVALTAHELGHALALKARGGEVHETGVLLLFGMPCLYVNVSDAWLLPARRDRLIVSAAGLIVEAALFGAAALALAFVPLHGPAAAAVFAVASVCGVRSLAANLNPLVRLDGYYLLSDLAGVPNLRSRAFALLAAPFRRQTAPDGDARPAGRRGERILLWCYGLLALPYGVLLIGVVLYLGGRWLVAHGGTAGLVVWSVVAVLVATRAASALVRAVRGGTTERA